MQTKMLTQPIPLRWLLIAAGTMILLLITAFIGAQFTFDQDYFSLHPPATKTDISPALDIPAEQLIPLYQTFYTGWATVILLLPAFIWFWFRNRSENGARIWILFWTISFLTFMVHLFVAMFIFFQGNFEHMTHTSRVSAFWPAQIAWIWWGIDLILAWKYKSENRWIRIQRILIHLFVFVLFVGGSAFEGELVTSRILGFLLAAATLVALGLSFFIKRRQGS